MINNDKQAGFGFQLLGLPSSQLLSSFLPLLVITALSIKDTPIYQPDVGPVLAVGLQANATALSNGSGVALIFVPA